MNGRSGAVRTAIASRFAAGSALWALAACAPAAASPVRIHATEGSAAFLAGTFEGVRLDDEGALTLAARFERAASIPEPFAFAAAALPDGWAIGTGNDGKVLKVGRDGTVSVLFDADEPEVFALWSDPDGTLFAGSSPDGKVYRIRDGRAESFFDPDATYIWALSRGADGALWVATGVEGKLYRVGADGRGELAYDAGEPHLRSLLALPSGDLLIGTVGQGRILRRDPAGRVTTLHDSPLAEVVALARGAGGEIFAAVVASEASFVELEPKPREGAVASAPAAAPDPDSESGEAVAAGTRAAGASGPRSELVRILADGVARTLWSSAEETLYALLPETRGGGRLWLGTGGEGRLYSLRGDSVRYEADFEERQIVALLPSADGPAFLTTNAAALYRAAPGVAARGSFTGAVADAGQPARFGQFRFRGALPRGSTLALAFRSGMSSIPDETWSDWSAAVELRAAAGEDGGEVAVPAAGPARYFQFRLDFTGAGEAAPAVARTEVAYRQINQRPEIERFGALDPGQILVPANFNPADQTYEPASPNRDGIFTTLEPTASDARSKTLWKRGMRTLRWKASDPNGDELLATLAVRPERSGRSERPERPERPEPSKPAPGRDDGWIEIAGERKGESFGFDAAALPDGLYRFRLTVSDRPGNDAASALTAERLSELVVIDHSPPRRSAIERRAAGSRLTLVDDWNPIVSAEISTDAGEWTDLVPVDGLIDGRSETFDLAELPRGARLVLLRVADAAFNVVTYDLSGEGRP